jgi:hypothetical protein
MDKNNIITDYVGDGSIYLRVDRAFKVKLILVVTNDIKKCN